MMEKILSNFIVRGIIGYEGLGDWSVSGVEDGEARRRVSEARGKSSAVWLGSKNGGGGR
jgi:hypothetical protein